MKFIKDFKSFKLNEDNNDFNATKLELKLVLGEVSDQKISGAKWQLLYNGSVIETGETDIAFSTNPQTPSYQGAIDIKSDKSPIKTLKFSVAKNDAKNGAELPIKQGMSNPNATNLLQSEIIQSVKPTPVEIVISDGFEMDSSVLKPESITQIKEKLAAAKLDKTKITLFVATGASQNGDVNQVLTNKEGTPKRRDYDYNLVVQRYATLKSLLEGEGYKVQYKSYPKKEGEKIYGVYQKVNKEKPEDTSNRNLIISTTLHTVTLDNLNYIAV